MVVLVVISDVVAKYYKRRRCNEKLYTSHKKRRNSVGDKWETAFSPEKQATSQRKTRKVVATPPTTQMGLGLNEFAGGGKI